MSSIATKLPSETNTSLPKPQTDSIEQQSPSNISSIDESIPMPAQADSPDFQSSSTEFPTESRTCTPCNESSTTRAMSGSPLTPKELNSSSISMTETSSLTESDQTTSTETEKDDNLSGNTFVVPVILDSSSGKGPLNPQEYPTTRIQHHNAPPSAFNSPLPDHHTVVIKNLPLFFQWKDIRDLIKSKLPKTTIVKTHVLSPGVGCITIKGYQNAETLVQTFSNFHHSSGNVLIAYINNPGHSVPPSNMSSVVSSPMPGSSAALSTISPQQLNTSSLVPHLQALSMHQISSAPSTPAMQHTHVMPSPMLASPPHGDPFMLQSQIPFSSLQHPPPGPGGPIYPGHPGSHFSLSMGPQPYMNSLSPIGTTFGGIPSHFHSPDYWVSPAGPPPFFPSNYPIYGPPQAHHMHTSSHRNYNNRARGFSNNLNHKNRNPGDSPNMGKAPFFNQHHILEGSSMSHPNNGNRRRGASYPGVGRPSGNFDNTFRLFIGNIPYTTQWQELKDFLRAAGEIYRVEIPENSEGRAKGFAIATYQSMENATKAIEKFNGAEFQGRELTVRFDKFNHTHSSVPNTYYYNSGYGTPNRSRLPSLDGQGFSMTQT